jgi:UTP--glucose-1-phosphate uridylyltransferase
VQYTKAIIAVAGYGTRRLPITKALEKCMLPVGNRPIIDYVVDDCIKAGITEFYFVVGEEFSQLKRYYGHHQLLEEYLQEKGKLHELAEITQLRSKARFHYVIQDQHQPYGTTTPIWLCRQFVHADEKVLVVFGDQFFHRTDGQSEMTRFMARAQQSDAPAAMLANEVSWDDVSHYGILETREENGQEIYKHIVEKPAKEDAPTNLNNSSCFLIGRDIFPFLEENVNTERSGEYLFTDVINAYTTAGNRMAVFRAEGEWLDCGTTQGWLHANQRIIAG